ncbi:class II fumarate hydratase [Candidatus Finniella inopinata]|uniref:Fumarate hydratase class II n=1 Tax=Candidatus Finniella inopinata TaxID=1696036 RepID=A0A4Q7DFM0_9PROT|nr:class II fumarate hydratase [Candidatus Finniella inopinata]RZI45523.1 class II fumarate hydratase [Candidatus Finniella inopinata]
MQDFRYETDSMGQISVLNDHYWGAQTQRSMKYFHIGEEKMPMAVILALVTIKKAAAMTNRDLGILEPQLAGSIVTVCDELLTGKWDHQFPLKVWQTGSGTQTNMNVNEVIANRANELLGQPLGTKHPIHPNDHVNSGQSSNDCFPTAMHMAAVQALTGRLLPALKQFQKELEEKADAFKDTVKVGRTHLQDAVPMTVGQEFGAFAYQIEMSIERLQDCLKYLYPLAQGGTAVGTGMNCPPGFVEKFIHYIREFTEFPFTSAPNKFEALASHDALVNLSGALNTLAASCMKIANDIRWLASGPRCGLGELHLPENEPGSSIMPGKVNPTQAETMTMVCCQVMGNHTTITVAGSQGHFQLNVFKPVIIYNLLQSMQLLGDVCESFTEHCLQGLTVNQSQLDRNLERSLMGAAALNPLIGYDQAAKVAQAAFVENKTLEQVVVEKGIMTAEDFRALRKV